MWPIPIIPTSARDNIPQRCRGLLVSGKSLIWKSNGHGRDIRAAPFFSSQRTISRQNHRRPFFETHLPCCTTPHHPILLVLRRTRLLTPTATTTTTTTTTATSTPASPLYPPYVAHTSSSLPPSLPCSFPAFHHRLPRLQPVTVFLITSTHTYPSRKHH